MSPATQPGTEADIGKHVAVGAHGNDNGMHPIESCPVLLVLVLLHFILCSAHVQILQTWPYG